MTIRETIKLPEFEIEYVEFDEMSDELCIDYSSDMIDGYLDTSMTLFSNWFKNSYGGIYKCYIHNLKTAEPFDCVGEVFDFNDFYDKELNPNIIIIEFLKHLANAERK